MAITITPNISLSSSNLAITVAGVNSYVNRVEEDRIKNYNLTQIDSFIGIFTSSFRETWNTFQLNGLGSESFFDGFRYNSGEDRIIDSVYAVSTATSSNDVVTFDIKKAMTVAAFDGQAHAGASIPTQSIYANDVFRPHISASAITSSNVGHYHSSASTVFSDNTWKRGELLGVVVKDDFALAARSLTVILNWKLSASYASGQNNTTTILGLTQSRYADAPAGNAVYERKINEETYNKGIKYLDKLYGNLTSSFVDYFYVTGSANNAAAGPINNLNFYGPVLNNHGGPRIIKKFCIVTEVPGTAGHSSVNLYKGYNSATSASIATIHLSSSTPAGFVNQTIPTISATWLAGENLGVRFDSIATAGEKYTVFVEWCPSGNLEDGGISSTHVLNMSCSEYATVLDNYYARVEDDRIEQYNNNILDEAYNALTGCYYNIFHASGALDETPTREVYLNLFNDKIIRKSSIHMETLPSTENYRADIRTYENDVVVIAGDSIYGGNAFEPQLTASDTGSFEHRFFDTFNNDPQIWNKNNMMSSFQETGATAVSKNVTIQVSWRPSSSFG